MRRMGTGMIALALGLVVLRLAFWALGFDEAVVAIAGGVSPRWNDPITAALLGVAAMLVQLGAVALAPVLLLAGGVTRAAERWH